MFVIRSRASPLTLSYFNVLKFLFIGLVCLVFLWNCLQHFYPDISQHYHEREVYIPMNTYFSYSREQLLVGWTLVAGGEPRVTEEQHILTKVVRNLSPDVLKVLDEAYTHLFSEFHALCLSPALLPLPGTKETLMVNRLFLVPGTDYDETAIINNYLYRSVLDHNYALIQKPMMLPMPVATGWRTGPEDPRIHRDPVSGDVAVLFLMLDIHQTRRQYLWWMSQSKLVRLIHPDEKQLTDWSKNWVFINSDNTSHVGATPREVELVFSVHPLIILQCAESGHCRYQNSLLQANQSVSLPTQFPLSGGTPFEHYRDNYYFAFIHSNNNHCSWKWSKRYMMHFAVIWHARNSGSSRLVFVSDPILFHSALLTNAPHDSPDMRWIANSFFFPVSIAHFNVTADVIHVGTHRNDQECVVVAVQGMFRFMREAIRIDEITVRKRRPHFTKKDKSDEVEKLTDFFKNLCHRWNEIVTR